MEPTQIIREQKRREARAAKFDAVARDILRLVDELGGFTMLIGRYKGSWKKVKTVLREMLNHFAKSEEYEKCASIRDGLQTIQ